MNTQIDVTADSFAAQVLEESRRRPVVVDFWAAWCGPCRMLGPLLERLADEARGRWLLAKVDVDREQALAMQFQVQGIPAVKAFRDGALVAEFSGAQPEREVRRFLDAIVPGPADDAAAEGERLVTAGRDAEARAAFERALSLKPRQAKALVALARLDAKEGRAQEALARLELLLPSDRDRHAAELAQLQLELHAASTGGVEAARAGVEAAPDDLDAKVALGRALAAERRHEEALETFLAVVHRSPRKGAGEDARRAMLEVFDVVGARSDLADEYRSRLAQELYR